MKTSRKAWEKKIVAALMGVTVLNTITPWAAMYTDMVRMTPPHKADGRQEYDVSRCLNLAEYYGAMAVERVDRALYGRAEATDYTDEDVPDDHVLSGGETHTINSGHYSAKNVSGGTQIISNGTGTVSTMTGGTQNVFDGGTGTVGTMNDGKQYFAKSGTVGTMSGGTQYVGKYINDGGTVVDVTGAGGTITTLAGSGMQIIYSGNTGTVTTMKGGTQNVQPGAAAATVGQMDGGTQNISGTEADPTSGAVSTMNGGEQIVNAFATGTVSTMNSGQQTVSNGGTGTIGKMNSGTQDILSGGSGIIGGTGAGEEMSGGAQNIGSDGFGTITTMCGGAQNVSSGGSGTVATMNNGLQVIASDASGSISSLSGGQQLVNGTGTVGTMFGGEQQVNPEASGTVLVMSGGRQVICNLNGSNAVGVVRKMTDGTQLVYSGGSGIIGGTGAGEEMLGGTQIILNETSATVIKMNGGSQVISAGGKGTVSTMTGGMQDIKADGSGLIVDFQGGTQYISAGGTGEVTNLNGGTQIAEAGATKKLANFATGEQVVETSVTGIIESMTGGTQTVNNGGTGKITSMTSGTQAVLGIGSVGTMDSGTQVISAGGNGTVSTLNGGSQVISSGGSGTVSTLNGGVQRVSGTGTVELMKGGAVSIEQGGTAYINSANTSAGYLNFYGSGATAVFSGKDNMLGYMDKSGAGEFGANAAMQFVLPGEQATMVTFGGSANIAFGGTVGVDTTDYKEGKEITLLATGMGLYLADTVRYKVDGEELAGGRGVEVYDVNTPTVTGLGAKETLFKLVDDNKLTFATKDMNILAGKFIAADGTETENGAELKGADPTDKAIYAAYSDSTTKGAEGGSLTLDGVTLSDTTRTIYAGNKNAKENSIVLENQNTLGTLDLSGKDNTLGVNSTGNTAAGLLAAGQNLQFFLPYDVTAGASMLQVTAATDVGGAAISVNASDVDVTSFHKGDKVTLLSSENGITAAGTTYELNNRSLDPGKGETVLIGNELGEYGSNKGVDIKGLGFEQGDKYIAMAVQKEMLAARYTDADGKELGDGTLDLTADAAKYESIYGAYSETTDATGTTVNMSSALDLSNSSLIGGYSAGGGTVSNNKLNVNAAGSKVKSLGGFSEYGFALSADTKPGDVFLRSAEGVDFSGATINTTNPAILELDEDESISLVASDTAHTYSDSTVFQLDGKEVKPGEGITRVAKKEKWVTVGELAYDNTTDAKSLLLTNKTKFIAASYTDAEGEVTAMDKSTATLTDDAAKYKAIYGAYSEKGQAGGATIKINTSVDLGHSDLIGGYSADDGSVNGNTLQVSALGVKVGSVRDFETVKFVLPPETQKEGSVVLEVSGKADMKATRNVNVDTKAATNIHKGGRVDLMKAGQGIEGYAPRRTEVIGLTTKNYSLALADANTLRLTVEDEKQNQNTKAPVEAVVTAVTVVNRAADFVTTNLSRSLTEIKTSDTGKENTDSTHRSSRITLPNSAASVDIFGAVGGGSSRYETGSHVNVRGWNLALGLGRKNSDKQNNATSYGLFFEYGKSNFDTHNDGDFRGDGRSNYRGIGLMVNHERANGMHFEASARLGKVDAEWNNAEFGGYDDKATYYGFHAGVGKKLAVGRNALDVYGRYLYNHIGSMKGNIGGYDYDFDAVNSSRLRIGARLEFNSEFGIRNSELTPSPQPYALRPYVGLAWEHEFSGDANATVLGLGRVDAPSLAGNTGILELGCNWRSGKWDLNLGVEGYTGVRKGVSGGIKFNYNF